MIILYTGIVLLCYSLISQKKYNLLVGCAFFLLIMGLQSNVDSDYETYQNIFENAEQSRTADDEPLWDILSYCFRPFGWYFFVFCISLFQCFVVYRLVKKYNTADSTFIAPILFFFTYGMMLIQMTAMRQGLAMETCLLPFLFDFSNKRKRIWPYFLVPMISAYLIHNSSVVMVVPLLYYYYLLHKRGKANKPARYSNFLFPVIVECVFIVVYIGKQYVFNDLFQQISLLANANDMRLSGYLELGNEVDDVFELSWLIVLYDAIMIFLSAVLFSSQKGVYKVFAMMSILGFFLDTLLFGMGSMPRLGYYFVIANIVTIPCLYVMLKNRYGKLVSFLFLLFCFGYAVKTSFPYMTGTEHGGYGTYKFLFMQ